VQDVKVILGEGILEYFKIKITFTTQHTGLIPVRFGKTLLVLGLEKPV
jgi:hypothetical protein